MRRLLCFSALFHPFSEQEKKLIVDQVFRDLVKEDVVSDKFELFVNLSRFANNEGPLLGAWFILNFFFEVSKPTCLMVVNPG